MTDKKSDEELAQDYVRENIHPYCGCYCDCYEVSNGFLAGLAAGRAQALEEAASLAFESFGTCGECSSNIGHAIRALKEKP